VNLLRRLVCSLPLAFPVSQTCAQTYPTRPIKLIVPFPPGGSADLVVRNLAPRLGELLGQQVVIEYKPGAGGSIGTAEVSRAAPDGHTLVMVWDTHAVNHYLYKVQYDFAKSFEPITLMVQAAGILVAHPAFPASNLKELIDYAKANPGKVTYGTAGAGSSNHLPALRFEEMTGVSLTHIPYKGGGPMIADLIGGHLNMVFGTMPLFEQHVRSGAMKALAVLSKTRLERAPTIPAASETLPGFEARTWFGLLTPAGTPKDIVARLQQAVTQALADPKVKEQYDARGFQVVGNSSDAFATFLKQESDASALLVRRAGIKAE
jgi:tripartite-type tricarboxylate transporter receptor subunit TctC